MNRRTWAIVGALAALAVGTVSFWPRSDAQLSAALVGRWVATDPTNASLHKHEEGVEREEIDIRPDGTLTYHVKLKPGSATAPAGSTRPATTRPMLSSGLSDGTIWGWRVMKGRLQIRDMGEDSTQEWMKPLKFSVSRHRFSISRRNFDTKEFERLPDG